MLIVKACLQVLCCLIALAARSYSHYSPCQKPNLEHLQVRRHRTTACMIAQQLTADMLTGRRDAGQSPSGRDGAAAGVMIMWSDRPRALSQRERMWAAAVAAKLCSTLS